MRRMEQAALLLLGLAIGTAAGWFFRAARLAATEAQRDAAEKAKDEALAQLREESARRGSFEALASRIPDLQQELAVRETSIRQQQQTILEISNERESLAARIGAEQEKLKLLADARTALAEQFQNLANQILDEKGRKIVEQNVANLDMLLKPLGERLKEFQGRVEETYDKESKQRFSLQNEIEKLVELNTRMSADAVNLTNALKGDSQAQGAWGELVLERVLEASGLQKGREYDIQVSLKDDEGRRWKPDVVVRLPEDKHVVVDAKVSLTAYDAYCAAGDDATRKAELANHIASVRSHIEELGKRNYQALYGIRTPDFVLMFVPVEPAFLLAARERQDLFLDAFQRNVMIVSPTTLLISLRTIASIWRYEYQNRNAQELVRQCTALYEKFAGFVEDLEDVGRKLELARKSYDDAHGKLVSGRGNLVRSTERIRELGLKPARPLPRHLTEAAAADEQTEADAAVTPLTSVKSKPAA